MTTEEFRVTYRLGADPAGSDPRTSDGFISWEHIETWKTALARIGDFMFIERVERCEVTRSPWVEVAREPAPVAFDAHVSYVPGEDPQIAALREMVNGNRELLGIDGEGGGEER